MEVDHPHLEKKNFKEYFLEFLMIISCSNDGILCGEYERAF